jgi:hypothetical protein
METSDLCLQQHLIMDRGSMPGGRQARGNVGAVGRNDSAGWKGRLAAGCGNLLGAPLHSPDREGLPELGWRLGRLSCLSPSYIALSFEAFGSLSPLTVRIMTTTSISATPS